MANLAVFLGAGASKEFGYPLTREILPEILERIDRGTLFRGVKTTKKNAEDRRTLESFLHRSLPGMESVNRCELPLITELLSFLDYSIAEAIVLHPAEGLEHQQHVRSLMERAIYEAIGGGYPLTDNAVSPSLKRFSRWLQSQTENGPIGIISTNYDVAVDTVLFHPYTRESAKSTPPTVEALSKDFDFGFAWREVTDQEVIHVRPKQPRFHLFKLHGSLNWVRCPLCEQIYVNPVGDIASVAFLSRRAWENTCHCGYSPLQMHIVAPSYARQVRDSNLRETWKHALQLLREAAEWVIIGYSFPPEDLAIRLLFTRAYHAHRTDTKGSKLHIHVVQKGIEAMPRYKTYFDSGNHDEQFRYEPRGLQAFLDSVGLNSDGPGQ